MKRHIILGLVVAAIIFLWGASWYFIPQWYDKQDLEAGTFGDMFGAVNALFSGLAFAGLIYTIAVQRQELQEQRNSINMQTEELTLQRKAIQMQTEELALQRKAIEMQTVETARSADQLERQKQLMDYQLMLSTVNDLIKLKNSIVDKLSLQIYDKKHNGWELIKELSIMMENQPNRYFDNELIVLGRYRSTYSILIEFISKADLSKVQSQNLKRIVIANTSQDELKVLEHFSIITNDRKLLEFLKIFGSHNF
ncbi:hypothetical protein [Paenibacillus sp. FSL R5-0473]|uniref:hypothetical protein n=1 Tax=Paenibacillus sp. FSL R5-0473 TaxID=2921642 RepID=UPI0030F8C538